MLLLDLRGGSYRTDLLEAHDVGRCDEPASVDPHHAVHQDAAVGFARVLDEVPCGREVLHHVVVVDVVGPEPQVLDVVAVESRTGRHAVRRAVDDVRDVGEADEVQVLCLMLAAQEQEVEDFCRSVGQLEGRGSVEGMVQLLPVLLNVVSQLGVVVWNMRNRL